MLYFLCIVALAHAVYVRLCAFEELASCLSARWITPRRAPGSAAHIVGATGSHRARDAGGHLSHPRTSVATGSVEHPCPRVVPCTRRAPILPERQLALEAQRCALYKRSRRIFPSIQPHRPSNIPQSTPIRDASPTPAGAAYTTPINSLRREGVLARPRTSPRSPQPAAASARAGQCRQAGVGGGTR